LNAVVTSGRQLIPGLNVEDFEVFENGIRQELSFFASGNTPVTVLVLLDSSSSILPSVEGIKVAASNFVRKLRQGDRAMIGFFNQDVWFATDFTGDVKELVRASEGLRPGGMTALYDAALESLRRLATVHGRAALLVFTDGSDSWPAAEGSDATQDEAIEESKLSDVSIYTVGFEGRLGTGVGGVNRYFLRNLARETGGRVFFPRDIGELNVRFSRIMEELHSQYRMAYVPKNAIKDGTWRRIQVRIKGADHLDVRTRQGYYAVQKTAPTTDS
jgi:Ca-activated chloride channel family protein